MAEEAEIVRGSAGAEEENYTNRAVAEEEEEEPEEGEIVGGDEKPLIAIAQQSHPLEHSWTFWFDNPSAKSKQAAWGSSISPVHTFSTAEEFWGYISLFIPSYPHQLLQRNDLE
ncbi:hypothetical protein HHK36_001628 [Tetracentron sinense]|uniref:eIF-4F 25 kDa subunit n=1 Tax=Tetracentron sinense TaxID=13715 RepID=A0A834ZUD2_TETSI|nr:hypothetical protein HHK36_001628 [Tetracentron sinense]